MRDRVLWVTLAVVAAVAILPIVTVSDTMREEIFLILLYVVLASSVNIMMGYTGYVTFGHIVFFGLGGYTGFYLVQNHGANFVLAALAGGIVSGAVAFGLGIPVLRLRGAYFALATIGVNEVARAAIGNIDQLGGSVGMFFNVNVYQAYGGARGALWLAYEAMVVVALANIATSYIIKKSKFGLGLMAIREDQDAAQVLGIDPARAKVITFTISAFFPGLAGALFFFKNGIIEPSPAFEFTRSLEALVIVMLGGWGTVTGPIVGSVVYEQLRGYLLTSPTFSSFHLFLAGLMLLLIVLFVTAGVVGWLRQKSARLRRYLA
ncbi:MAG TPA: branched-chain amino acid ABC transporter permease [Chloroflexota bacterium]